MRARPISRARSFSADGGSSHVLRRVQLAEDRQSSDLTRQSHASVLSAGYDQDAIAVAKLISAYSACGDFLGARRILNSFHNPNLYIWNSAIHCFAKNGARKDASDMYNQMRLLATSPDENTLSALSKIAGEDEGFICGPAIHGVAIRTGFCTDTVLCNSIVSMYVNCGRYDGARKAFDEIPQRNCGSWNAIISGCIQFEQHERAWSLLAEMQDQGTRPDHITVSKLLSFCDDGRRYGRELHCYVLRNTGSGVHLGCCLICMYARSKNTELARRIFDRLDFRNVFVWTAMINGYILNRDPDEALSLLGKMRETDGVEPNHVTLVAVLPACFSYGGGGGGGLVLGRLVHGFAVRRGFDEGRTSLCNSLMDMYAKCGSLIYASRVFEKARFARDLVSWGTMIAGHGLHGRGDDAVFLYRKMISRGVLPDAVTVVGIVSACGRSGLVDDGLEIYSSAILKHGVETTMEMCACVVDMLGRAGRHEEAMAFVRTMTMEPGPSVWGAILTYSEIHGGDGEIRDLARRTLIETEPNDPSNLVSMSNSYASSSRWNEVWELRETMRQKGLEKVPGCSWIVVGRRTHCFFAADANHSCSESIYDATRRLFSTMTELGSPSIPS